MLPIRWDTTFWKAGAIPTHSLTLFPPHRQAMQPSRVMPLRSMNVGGLWGKNFQLHDGCSVISRRR